MGGGWDDPTYAFPEVFAISPFNRYETNGFRCIKYIDPDGNRLRLQKMINVPFRDFKKEKPVSDETFALFLKQYDYDKTNLNATIESREESDDWTMEKVSFNAAYGNERVKAYLFLPRHGNPPFQTVIFFPGSNALYTRSSSQIIDEMRLANNEMFPKSGRAFLYPIYKSTFERSEEKQDLNLGFASETVTYKEHVIMWAKDLSRSIDYLKTRKDIDTDKLAYYGFSWGGYLGSIMLALEKRIKASVLYVVGLDFYRTFPEVDLIHYLPRVKIPVLMINGELDFFFPVTTSQRPFYDLLGTPEEDKELFLYPGGHSVPRAVLIDKTLAWLDKYLGPVD